MTPFDGIPRRACEGGPLGTQHNLHNTGHAGINKQRIAGLRCSTWADAGLDLV